LKESLGARKSCHLNEKAEEDQKVAKEAAAQFNVQVAGQWCLVTKPRKSPRDIQSLIISSRRSFDKRAHTLPRPPQPSIIACLAQCTVAS
jgi:hypothetical protein